MAHRRFHVVAGLRPRAKTVDNIARLHAIFYMVYHNKTVQKLQSHLFVGAADPVLILFSI